MVMWQELCVRQRPHGKTGSKSVETGELASPSLEK
jgi:hypothetical protein